MGNYPSRESLAANVLRNLSRQETPGRYVAVERLKTFLYKLSQVQYEEFLDLLRTFDPEHIDPKVKENILRDISKNDETGVIRAMAESAFQNADLLRYAKAMLIEVMP